MPDYLHKATGMLLGLAVGDALGSTLEFGPRRPLNHLHTEMSGGGPFHLHPGQWTDDTAMAVGLAHSLIEQQRFDPFSILSEWCAWYQSGKHSCTSICFDIGNATRLALDTFLRDPKKLPAIPDASQGNGTLMRLAPAILFARSQHEAEAFAYRQSTLTHSEATARKTAEFGCFLFGAWHGTFDGQSISESIRNRARGEVRSSGYYLDTFEAALWAVTQTHSFEEAVVQAVNLGDDADTVGAVTGQLAGALYGEEAIPERWLEKLAWRETIRGMAVALCEK